MGEPSLELGKHGKWSNDTETESQNMDFRILHRNFVQMCVTTFPTVTLRLNLISAILAISPIGISMIFKQMYIIPGINRGLRVYQHTWQQRL